MPTMGNLKVTITGDEGLNLNNIPVIKSVIIFSHIPHSNSTPQTNYSSQRVNHRKMQWLHKQSKSILVHMYS